MSWFEKLLCKLFNFTDIGRDSGAPNDIYLRRWFIWPRNPENHKKQRRLYLHKFYQGDRDEHLHDHPWGFQSLILKGGYYEHSFNPAWKKHNILGVFFGTKFKNIWPEPSKTRKKWYGPFSYLKRGARWAHKVELKPGKTCWTLFLTEVKSRSWGFHTDDGWCWWRNYRDGICWCYDKPNE